MEVLKLTLPLPPSLNHYLNMRIVRVGNRRVPRAYESRDSKNYKISIREYIKDEVDKQGWHFNSSMTQHYYCDCVFYLPRTGKDCSNYFKVLLDGITDTEAVWPDDSLVLERVDRVYIDKQDPRIEIEIRPVEYVGIFSDKQEAEKFEDRCKTCFRYQRNCSLLRKAKEGRIQPEIDECCMKYKEAKK